MAVEELQLDGYPYINRPSGEWYETRVFRTTSQSEALTTFGFGVLADTGYFTATTPPLYYKDLTIKRRSRKDSDGGGFVWEVEVTAATLTNIISYNPDQSLIEEAESEGIPFTDSTGNVNYVQAVTRYSRVRVVTQSDMDKIDAERKKIGLVSNSYIPGTGGDAGEWRLVNVAAGRVFSSTNGLIEIAYKYYRAPLDADGNQQTWATWAAAQSPAITLPTGDVSPLR